MFDFRAWLRKTFTPVLGASAVAAIMAGQASAGNIVLTGHDDDFHQSVAALNQISDMIAFARKAAPTPGLKVLTFDQDGELTGALTKLGIAFDNVDPSKAGAVTAGLFDVTKYSAIAIAAAQSCGGCDNTVAGYNNISAQKAAIANFINAGGGVAQMTGGTSAASRAAAYAYLPKTAGITAGTPPSVGYVQTADGKANGVRAVDGDTTHNLFNEPGTGGTSPAYLVFERLSVGGPPGAPPGGWAETIGIAGAAVVGTTIIGTVPEPATVSLAAMGLASLAGYRLRKRAKKAE
jgi:hypothetical protein